MTAEPSDPTEASAVLWHIRLRDGDDVTWDQFIAWLAEDPRHRIAYDRIEALDQALDPVLPDVMWREAANDTADDGRGHALVRGARRGGWALAGGLLVASLVAAVLLGPSLASSRYEVVTGPGDQRQIALDATTTIILNGSTRITLDRKDTRFAALTSGEALFKVHHDPVHPFTLALGDRRVEDIGTLFDVVRDTGGIRVAVAEGKVAYRTDGSGAGPQGVPVAAGQALSDPADNDTIRITPAPAGSVGGWRAGRLVFAGTALADVARDIGRSLGVRMTVAPAISRRPISGVITLAGRDGGQAQRLAAVLDITIVTGPDGWIMQPRSVTP